MLARAFYTAIALRAAIATLYAALQLLIFVLSQSHPTMEQPVLFGLAIGLMYFSIALIGWAFNFEIKKIF